MGSIPIGGTFFCSFITQNPQILCNFAARSSTIILQKVMATFKAEVYAHQKKADGTYNIKIRVTQNQRKRYLATPWYVTKDDLIRSYRSKCDLLGTSIRSMGVDEVVACSSLAVWTPVVS